MQNTAMLNDSNENEDLFKLQLQNQKIEQTVMRYFQNKEIESERKEECVMLKEDLGHLLGDSTQPMVFPLQNGEFAVVKQNIRSRDVLNKEALAEYLKMSKEELKTPLDFSMLTFQNKLAPETIKDFMEKKETRSITIKKLKKNPLKDKKGKKNKQNT